MKTYNVTDITNITRGTVLDMSMERDTARRECHAGKESWEAAGVGAAEGRAGGGEKEEITHLAGYLQGKPTHSRQYKCIVLCCVVLCCVRAGRQTAGREWNARKINRCVRSPPCWECHVGRGEKISKERRKEMSV